MALSLGIQPFTSHTTAVRRKIGRSVFLIPHHDIFVREGILLEESMDEGNFWPDSNVISAQNYAVIRDFLANTRNQP